MELYLLHTLINYFAVGVILLIVQTIYEFNSVGNLNGRWYKMVGKAFLFIIVYPYIIFMELWN